MAGPYYVDSNAAFAANLGNTGLSAASPWGGAGGLQKALLGWAAGETIYLIAGGTATLSQIWKVTGTLTGSIAAGETVAQGSNTGVAIIAASGVTLFVSSLTGFSASGTITGSGGGTMVYSGGNITQPGLGSFGGGTLAAGRCKIIGITYIGGVELNDHLTQVDINAASCTYGINANDWLHLENLSFRNGVSHLLNGNGKSYCRLINVKGTNAGAGTFYNWYTSSFDRCGSDGAHTYGFYVRDYSILSDCYAINGGSSSVAVQLNAGGNVVQHSLIRDNANSAIQAQGSSRIEGNTITRNSLNGVIIPDGSTNCRVVNNRIISNGTAGYYGLNLVTAGNGVDEDGNVYYGNGNGSQDVLHFTPGPNSVVASTLAQVGFTNAAGNNFMLTSAALNRRMAIVIDAINTAYRAAGIAPNDPTSSGGMSRSRLIGGIE